MYYHYNQNNSGGSFDVDKNHGITHHVVVEAGSPEEANSRAESIGLYWDGCESGKDCSCCGDRWSKLWSEEKGSDKPIVYGQPAVDHKDIWIKRGSAVAVHHKRGKIDWY